MPKYVFAYHGGGMPESEAEQQQHMAAWGAWFEANGASFTDMGAPTGAAMTVGPGGTTEGGGANPITGYGIVEAADMAAACSIAEGCPIVDLSGGSVQVAETFEVNM
jgi:hypothetical protein